MTRKLPPGNEGVFPGLVRSWTPPSRKDSTRWHGPHHDNRSEVGPTRRTEIYFHQFDGKFYLTGRPGFKRDWVANIVANPDFTLHLKHGVNADVAVHGEPEPDPEERARILYRALTESWG